MKTHSRQLRGYNNNQFSDRSKERHTATSARINYLEMKRIDTFSSPSLYSLPRVYSSRKRRDKWLATIHFKDNSLRCIFSPIFRF